MIAALPVTIIFAVAVLLALVSLALPLARALKLPYTVLVAALGLVLGLGVGAPDAAPGVIGDFLAALAKVRLPSEGLLALFLPPLLFSAGLSIDVRRLIDDLAPVVTLAVVAVIVCALTVGLWLDAITGYGLVACLLLGAIVSTTDAAAVVAIFRELGAPRRLVVLVEGESLFNDAAAIALFALLLGMLTGAGGASAGAGAMVFQSIFGFAGGIAVGFLMARGAGFLIARMPDAPAAEITITIALAYLSFLVCEYYLGFSGVMAVVTAAMVFAVFGRTQMSPGAWPALSLTWRMLDFWSTALVFCLAAMIVPQAAGLMTWGDLVIVGAIVVSTLIARAVVLYGFMPLLTVAGLAQPVSQAYKLVIWWGGLRGAVTIALGLAILETPALDEPVRRFIFIGSVGYVLATLFVQAPTLRPLLRLIGLDRLSGRERLERERAKALAQDAVTARLGALLAEAGRPRSFLGAQLSLAALLPAGGRAQADPQADDIALDVKAGLLAMTGRERELYLDYFNQGLISRSVADTLRAAAGRVADAIASGGPQAYEAAMYRGFRSGGAFKAVVWLNRALGVERPLADYLAGRLERLLVLDLAGRDLEIFVGEHLSGFIGPVARKGVSFALAQRREAIRSALSVLDIQYTNYLGALRDRQLSRMTLAMESGEYRRQRGLALISQDVYADLDAEIAERRRRLEQRPRLDIGERLRRMIRAVPLLSDLDPGAVDDISRMLRPRICSPGDIVIRAGDPGRSMFFIASGRLHVELPSEGVLLEPGDFVGELSLLRAAPRNATVIARGFASLLELDGRDLRRLMRRHPALRAQLERKAGERLERARPHPA